MKDNSKCRITMLRVSDGDCIFLEFAFDDRLFNILVDTGPASCWETVLRPFLDQLFEDKKKIDVLLITHIDGDHIGGALKLFDNEKYSNLVKEVWFNGLKQIAFNAAKEATEKEEKAFRELRAMHWHDAQEVDGPISAKQAESLVSLLVKRGKEANAFFQGFPITNNTASIQLSPEFYIDFLLPTVGKLEKMKSKFHIAMNQVVRGSALVVTPDSEVAFEHVMLDEWTEPDHIETISENNFNLSDVEKWGSFVTGKDSSITNASSIAICVRFYGRKLLFPGDAVSDDLTEALSSWKCEVGEDLYFDIVKLPHHGSLNNCGQLFDEMDGRRYLISTDGIKFSHPSKETIAKIVTRPTEHKRYLLFNYENKMYELFKDELAEKKYNYCAVFQTTSFDI